MIEWIWDEDEDGAGWIVRITNDETGMVYLMSPSQYEAFVKEGAQRA